MLPTAVDSVFLSCTRDMKPKIFTKGTHLNWTKVSTESKGNTNSSQRITTGICGQLWSQNSTHSIRMQPQIKYWNCKQVTKQKSPTVHVPTIRGNRIRTVQHIAIQKQEVWQNTNVLSESTECVCTDWGGSGEKCRVTLFTAFKRWTE